MNRLLLTLILFFAASVLSAKDTYFRFIEMNKYREFCGKEQVVEGEAKKIDCYQFKYDKQKRPVEIIHKTKGKESAGSFIGMGKDISKIQIEYNETFRKIYQEQFSDTLEEKIVKVSYKMFNASQERITFKGGVFNMVHEIKQTIGNYKTADKGAYSLTWFNYDKNGNIIQDYSGTQVYLIEFSAEPSSTVNSYRVINSVESGDNEFNKTFIVNPDTFGVSMCQFRYNDFGNLTMQTNYDNNNEKTNNTAGICETNVIYDDPANPRVKEWIRFDKEHKPVKNEYGSYRIKEYFDENNYLSHTLYLDSTGNAMENNDGFSYSKITRNECFFVKEINYYTSRKDTINKIPPKIKFEGRIPMYFVKKIKYEYDDDGKLTNTYEETDKNK